MKTKLEEVRSNPITSAIKEYQIFFRQEFDEKGALWITRGRYSIQGNEEPCIGHLETKEIEDLLKIFDEIKTREEQTKINVENFRKERNDK